MSMRVAKNNSLLKRRIEDFFDSCSERKEARDLIESLADQINTWIFGGMIRDIGLFGRRGFTSDIDIVVDTNREVLLRVLSSLTNQNLTCNKLGGIRFHYKNMDFDIWCLSDTWAFREKLIPLEDAQSLFKTTLMTWDAVLYNVHSRKVISPDNYLNDLINKRLELVLAQNPNETGSLIRILRTIYTKNVETLGPELCDFLRKTLHQYSFEVLLNYELNHYQTHSFNSIQIKKLVQNLQQTEPGCDLKVNSHLSTKQYPLKFS